MRLEGAMRQDPGLVRYDQGQVRRLARAHLTLGATLMAALIGLLVYGSVAGNPGVWFFAVILAVGAALQLFNARTVVSERKVDDWLAYELSGEGLRLPFTGLLRWEEVAAVELSERPLIRNTGSGATAGQAAAGQLNSGLARGLVRRLGLSADRRTIGVRVTDPRTLCNRLEGDALHVVEGRELLNKPHGMVHGEGLQIPFERAAHAIADAASGRGIEVRIRSG